MARRPPLWPRDRTPRATNRLTLPQARVVRIRNRLQEPLPAPLAAFSTRLMQLESAAVPLWVSLHGRFSRTTTPLAQPSPETPIAFFQSTIGTQFRALHACRL